MEIHKRSLVKAAVYKSGSFIVLMALSWLFTKNLTKMTLITISYEAIAIVGYYVHERLWNYIKWGKKE